MTGEERTPAPEKETEEGIDPIDPLKRGPDEDETMPGLDPVVSPIPPE